MTNFTEKTTQTLLTGSSDPNGDPRTVRRVNGAVPGSWPVVLTPANSNLLIGQVTIEQSGTVTFGDNGHAAEFPADEATLAVGSFTYTLRDPGGLESPAATCTLTLEGESAPAAVPSAFTAGMWSLGNAGSGTALTVTVASLPANGGAAITDIEAELDASGTWTSLGGATTGSYTISGLTQDVEVDVRLRGVNSVGNAAASDTKSATPTVVTGSGATLTGGTLAATVDLSGVSPGGSATHVEWRIAPAWGDETTPVWPSDPSIGGLTTEVPVASLGTPIAVSYIPLAGSYKVWTRERDGGGPITAWAPSTAATVSDTAAALAKGWYSDLTSLIGDAALGVTVGRTSTAPLTLIDGETMSEAEINAALPAGWGYNAANVTLSPPSGASAGNPAVLEDYEIRGMKVNITSGKDHIHFRQCLIYPISYSGAPFILVFRGGRIRDFSRNTVIGPRRYSGTGQVVQCQYPVNSPTEGRGIADHIAYNLCSGMSGDCFSTTGSPVTRVDGPDGCWIHHNVLDAVAWVSNFSGSGNWHDTSNAPHGDLITVKGSYDNGTFIEDNVFWHVPVEPVTIPASLAHDGVKKVAGAARPFAGSRGNPLGDIGHSSQNNVCRIVTDNLQIVDATTWAGPVRVSRFLHNRWAGMSGLPWDMDSGARAAGDIAIWDGISGASDPSQSYDATAFSNTERTVKGGYFLSDPTYSAAIVNCWTGAAVETIGSTGALASPL